MFESNLNKGKPFGYPPLDGKEKVPRKYIYYDFDTSSLATTGSNNFVGNEYISGSVSISGSITVNGPTTLNGPTIISGSAVVSGSVTASFFVGDGSNLTNIPNTGPIRQFNNSTLFSVTPFTQQVNNSNGIFFGQNAGFRGTHASNSTFFGFQSGYQATEASSSFFVGKNAGYGAELASDSTFFGFQAGYSASIAYNSFFVGHNAGWTALNANDSTFIGYGAGYNATNAHDSIFMGINAGSGATDAYNSMFLGNGAGEGGSSSNDAVFIGNGAGQLVSNGNYSIFIGSGAGNVSPDTNAAVFVGAFAGSTAASASSAVMIGFQAGLQANQASSSIFVGGSAGYGARQSESSTFIGQFSGVNAYHAKFSNFIGFRAGQYGVSSSYSNFFGNWAGVSVSSSYSNLFGYNAGLNYNAQFGTVGIGNNNIIIGTNLTFPDRKSSSLNIGGVLFGSNLYFNTGSIPFTGSQGIGRIGINVTNPTTNLDISGSGFVTGSFSVTNAPIHPTDVIRLIDLPQFSGSGLFYFANNGLTSSIGNVFQLGGDLIRNTNINNGTYFHTQMGNDGDNSRYQLTQGSGQYDIYASKIDNNNDFTEAIFAPTSISITANSSSGFYTALSINNTNFNLTAYDANVGFNSSIYYDNGLGLSVVDGIFQKGLVYSEDYSANGTLDPLWVPNWGAIQNALSSSLPGGTANYIPLWGTDSSLTSSIVYQSGSVVQIQEGSLEFSQSLASYQFTPTNGKMWVNRSRTNVFDSPDGTGIGFYPNGNLQLGESFGQTALDYGLSILNAGDNGFMLVSLFSIALDGTTSYGQDIPIDDDSPQVANTRFVKALLNDSYNGVADYIPIWGSNNTLTNSLLQQDGSTVYLTGSLALTNAPVNPNDVVRLKDNRYKGLWVSNTQIYQYDNVYVGQPYGNFIALTDIAPSDNTLAPWLASSVGFSKTYPDADNINSYLTWSLVSNNFTVAGDLLLNLTNTISTTNNSTFPYFTIPRSVLNDNWYEFNLETDSNTQGYYANYKFTPSLVPQDGAWYELLPTYQDKPTSVPLTSGTIAIHVDVTYDFLYYHFRLRTKLISGASGRFQTIITEFHRSQNKELLFSFNSPGNFPALPSDYWSILNGGTDPNTIRPNWYGFDSGSIAKLPGITRMADDFTDSTGSLFTKTITGGQSGSFALWDGTKTLTNSIISQSGSTVNISGSLSLLTISEKLTSIAGATGTVTNDFNNGDIFYYTSISSDFGVNFINTPLTDSRTVGFTLVLVQGATPRMVTSIQVNGVSQTINWLGGSSPTGTANKIDIIGISLIRLNPNWVVLGQISTFG